MKGVRTCSILSPVVFYSSSGVFWSSLAPQYFLMDS